MTFFKIHQLSQKTGVNVETIRYYEKTGLLPSPQRGANGYRQYDQSTVHLLAFIKMCRSLGFSMEEIKQFNLMQQNPHETCQQADEMVKAHLLQVQQKIAQLKEIESFLMGLSDCKAGEIAKCKVLRNLNLS